MDKWGKWWLAAMVFFCGSHAVPVVAKEASAEALSTAVVRGFSTRYATVALDDQEYRIDRNLLLETRDKLKSGVLVKYRLDLSRKEFPRGLITQLRVLGKNESHCPPFCL